MRAQRNRLPGQETFHLQLGVEWADACEWPVRLRQISDNE